MKKCYKSRKGFTLVEIIIVVAMLIIMLAATTLVISRFFTLAHTAEDDVDSAVESMSNFTDDANSKFEAVGF